MPGDADGAYRARNHGAAAGQSRQFSRHATSSGHRLSSPGDFHGADSRWFPAGPVRIFTLTGPRDQTPSASTLGRGFAGLIAANSVLVTAVLVYMGWAYDDAFYGYFHVSPLNIGVGVTEFLLSSLHLFSPALIVTAVVVIAISAAADADTALMKGAAQVARKAVARAPARRLQSLCSPAQRRRVARHARVKGGAAITVIALVLAWAANHVRISTYMLIVLFGSGPLLLTWPIRGSSHGRFRYALAIVVAVVCTVWAGSLYAHDLVTQAAGDFVQDLPGYTEVAIYSTQRLALSGPGVTVQHLNGPYQYHYRYEGLRLLTMRSGVYFLLPVGWTQDLDDTYMLNSSNMIRIVLY